MIVITSFASIMKLSFRGDVKLYTKIRFLLMFPNIGLRRYVNMNSLRRISSRNRNILLDYYYYRFSTENHQYFRIYRVAENGASITRRWFRSSFGRQKNNGQVARFVYARKLFSAISNAKTKVGIKNVYRFCFVSTIIFRHHIFVTMDLVSYEINIFPFYVHLLKTILT